MKQLLTAIIFICAINLQAQIDTYDISKYIYPDVKRQTLSLSPDLYMNSVNNGIGANYSTLAFDLGSSFNSINYNRSFQSELRIDGNLGLDFASKGAPSSRNEGISIDIFANHSHRKFYKPKRFFELESRLAFDSSKRIFSGRQSLIDLRLSPKIGAGRIEIVTDAWTAKTLFQFLRKNNLLLKEPSLEEINNLAIEITQIRNLRVIDFRLEDIAELERLIEYFIDNDFVDPENYSFYPILLDAYRFERIAGRRQGQTIKGGLSLSAFDFLEELVSSFNPLQFNAIVEFEKANAISSTWQFDQLYSIEPGILLERNWFDASIESYKFIALEASLTLGNYLSRRTYLSATFRSKYRNVIDSNNFLQLSIGGNYNYYFSPNTQMAIRLNMQLINSSSQIRDDLNHNENVSWSLIHYLR